MGKTGEWLGLYFLIILWCLWFFDPSMKIRIWCLCVVVCHFVCIEVLRYLIHLFTINTVLFYRTVQHYVLVSTPLAPSFVSIFYTWSLLFYVLILAIFCHIINFVCCRITQCSEEKIHSSFDGVPSWPISLRQEDCLQLRL